MKDQNLVENYGWTNSDGLNSGNYITPIVLQILKSHRAKRVADLGSGNGALCARLRSLGFDVVGVEQDRNGFEIASEHYSDIKFYNYGVQDDPKKLLEQEELFDAVISTEVIEHLYSPHLLPVYARSILKPNGLLIISTPYHGYLKNLALSIFDHWDAHHTPLWHGGHIKFFSRKTLESLLVENKFSVCDFYGAGRVPYLWKSMIMVAKPLS